MLDQHVFTETQRLKENTRTFTLKSPRFSTDWQQTDVIHT